MKPLPSSRYGWIRGSSASPCPLDYLVSFGEPLCSTLIGELSISAPSSPRAASFTRQRTAPHGRSYCFKNRAVSAREHRLLASRKIRYRPRVMRCSHRRRPVLCSTRMRSADYFDNEEMGCQTRGSHGDRPRRAATTHPGTGVSIDPGRFRTRRLGQPRSLSRPTSLATLRSSAAPAADGCSSATLVATTTLRWSRTSP